MASLLLRYFAPSFGKYLASAYMYMFLVAGLQTEQGMVPQPQLSVEGEGFDVRAVHSSFPNRH